MLPFDVNIAKVAVDAAAAAYTAATIETDLAHVLIKTEDAKLTVAFRGTQNAKDWLTDLDAALVAIPTQPKTKVHRGFLKALTSVIDQVVAEIEHSSPFHMLIVTGHSLGGALAMLAAPALRALGHNPDYVFTFGQPRVGNSGFSSGYDQVLRNRTWRFVNEEDIVPRVPFVSLGYRHAGQCAFAPSTGGLTINPPLFTLLLSDAVGIFEDYESIQAKALQVSALADHHIDRYRALVYVAAGVPPAVEAGVSPAGTPS
jgi:hypothetical protein